VKGGEPGAAAFLPNANQKDIEQSDAG